MARTIPEYYAFEYLPKCEIDDSFLSSWRGLAYPCRVIQYIFLPIQLLTGYFILKKTPAVMKTMKQSLLVFHVCCTIQDLHFLTLSTSYIFLPSYAFFGVGFFAWLEFPPLLQILPMFFVLFCTESATIYLFESRASINPENIFRFTRTRSRLIYYLGTLGLNCMIYILFIFKVPEDQEAAKLDILKFIPCPTREFFTEPVFVPADQEWSNLMLMYFIPVFIGMTLTQMLFFFSISVYYLFVRNFALSSKTRKLQKQFFIGILVQTGVPLCIFIFTYTALMVSYVMGDLTQAQMNVSIVIFGVHGFAESVVIILVHECYRKEVGRFLMRQ
ncbi:Protein CBR-SRH-89, partial [Caenorhabditis briggsae]